MKNNLIVAIILFAVAFTTNSCKKEDNKKTNNSSNLLGTWKKAYNSTMVGITFTADGKFSFGVYTGSSFMQTITGSWSTDAGGHITFSNQTGSMEQCPNTTCVYDYTVAGTSLVFAVDTDPCSGRDTRIGGGYIKQ